MLVQENVAWDGGDRAHFEDVVRNNRPLLGIFDRTFYVTFKIFLSILDLSASEIIHWQWKAKVSTPFGKTVKYNKVLQACTQFSTSSTPERISRAKRNRFYLQRANVLPKTAAFYGTKIWLKGSH